MRKGQLIPSSTTSIPHKHTTVYLIHHLVFFSTDAREAPGAPAKAVRGGEREGRPPEEGQRGREEAEGQGRLGGGEDRVILM